MKLKKLLLATTIAFALPVSASALTLDSISVNDLAPANEVDFAEEDFAGDLTFEVARDGTGVFTADTPYLVTVTLPAGALLSGSPTVSVGGDAEIGDVDVSSAVAGTDTYTFIYTPVTSATADASIGLSLPIYVSSCTDLGSTNLTVDIEREASGVAVESGTVSTTAANAVFGECADAVSATFTAATSPILTLESGYTNFSTTATPNSVAVIGSVEFEIDTAVSTEFVAVAPLVDADISSIAFNVNVPDGSIYSAMTVGSLAGTLTGNVFAFETTTTAEVTALTGSQNVTVTLDDDETVKSAQAAATITDVVVSYSATHTPSLLASTTEADGTLSTVDRAVADGGSFDWVSRTSANSVFRVTGLPASSTTPTTLILTNAADAAGEDVSGSYAGTVTSNAAGEGVMTSLNGFDASFTDLPVFSRADVEFEFEAAGSIDVDRLVVQGGQIFEMGDTDNN